MKIMPFERVVGKQKHDIKYTDNPVLLIQGKPPFPLFYNKEKKKNRAHAKF